MADVEIDANEEAQKAARTFNRILAQPKLNAAMPRTDKHVEDAIKKLRRLILVDGIPHAIVRRAKFSFLFIPY